MTQSGHPCKRPGRYTLSPPVFDEARLNKLCAEDLDHAGIVAALDPLFAAYAARRDRERFGHFTIRAGFVAASGNGADIHAYVRAVPPK